MVPSFIAKGLYQFEPFHFPPEGGFAHNHP
jgi:hypothetical protein